MENKYKRWIILALAPALIMLGLVAVINYVMDPLWCFTVSHRYNQNQEDFNERQQKTNYITFRGFNYNGILIGSSAVTNINQASFKGISIFNYAINGLQPAEYPFYINYIKKKYNRDIEFIIMGLDFISASKRLASQVKPIKTFDEIDSPLYRFKILISRDTLSYSRKNYLNTMNQRHIYYDRNNIKHVTPLPRETVEMHMRMGLEHHQKTNDPVMYNTFEYDSNYRPTLKRIKDENPRSAFIVFTTPVTVLLQRLLVENNNLRDYLRWLEDIVAVYGECYHFMYPNKITEDFMNTFHDPTHCNPVVNDMIVDAIFNKKINDTSEFGIYINRANVKEKLAYLERLMQTTRAR